MAKTWWQELTRQHLDRTTTPRASESWQRVVTYYGIIGSYRVQRAGPSLTSRPETHIRGREGRLNTGWPPLHIGQKSSSVMPAIRCTGGPLLVKIASISRKPRRETFHSLQNWCLHQTRNFYRRFWKADIRWTFSDFFIEQTVTTIARKLNFSGFPLKISGFFGTSVLQRVINMRSKVINKCVRSIILLFYLWFF